MKIKKLWFLIGLEILFLFSGCLEQTKETTTSTSLVTFTSTSSTTTLTTTTLGITTIIQSETTLTTSISSTISTTTTINPVIAEYLGKGYRELTLKVYIFCRTCKPIVNQRLRENKGVIKFFNEPKNVWKIIYDPTKTDAEHIASRSIGGYDYDILEDRSI